MGVELFSLEFAYPSRGVYPVPDFIPENEDFEFDFDFDTDLED